jgi:3,4-dihydroxy 2-butanone 4-phosphate synthase/GTP cyclohydrolase II
MRVGIRATDRAAKSSRSAELTLTTKARVERAIDAFGKGEIVVVTDDDDRENEGDLFVGASLCTPEKMAFIIRHTSGIVCAPLSAAEAERLRLRPMVEENNAPLGTAFTVSVDARAGLTTGISAVERTNTVRGLADAANGPHDFVRPGHVFPLVAREGGVLIRSGHTEAAVDLCRLAGLPLVGVLAELVNDDGSVKRGAEVAAFAETHGLNTLSIDDLIAFRQTREKLVRRVASFPAETPIGTLLAYVYVTPFDEVQHLALVHGPIEEGREVLVSIHRSHVISDVLQGALPIRSALGHMQSHGRGVLLYLRDGAVGVPATLQQEQPNGSEASRAKAWREIGLGAQILRDLGITSIRLLTSHKKSYVGLAGFGVEIVATEMLGPP